LAHRAIPLQCAVGSLSAHSRHGSCRTNHCCKRLTPLIRKTQPYTKRIAHKGIWVEPELLTEIEYRAKSAEGKVRHPFFRGLREDQ
jgi:ATP-dependent DNA ligase